MSTVVVRLARGIDRERPCCSNIAKVCPGRGPHVAELRCEGCGAHRGWLSKSTLTFITELGERFAAPLEPIILRDRTIGGHEMSKQTFENKPGYGSLFRCEKDKEGDRDYRGSVNIDGKHYSLSGWVKVSPKGTKWLSLSIKPQDEAAAAAKKPAEEFDDAIPF
jgi:hypothetical protein